mmetsp:Transcript_2863/g.6363  ORF Transcript_2863/g.6363 Transcript_2863/m.6363 type:complete len:251 (-) Transcript_2863:46-798(-)
MNAPGAEYGYWDCSLATWRFGLWWLSRYQWVIGKRAQVISFDGNPFLAGFANGRFGNAKFPRGKLEIRVNLRQRADRRSDIATVLRRCQDGISIDDFHRNLSNIPSPPLVRREQPRRQVHVLRNSSDSILQHGVRSDQQRRILAHDGNRNLSRSSFVVVIVVGQHVHLFRERRHQSLTHDVRRLQNEFAQLPRLPQGQRLREEFERGFDLLLLAEQQSLWRRGQDVAYLLRTECTQVHYGCHLGTQVRCQ